MLSTWKKLKYKAPLYLTGFDPLYTEGQILSPSTLYQLQLNNRSYQENYELFKEKIFSSIKNRYYPVYRMADGEFKFILNTERRLYYKVMNLLLNKKRMTTCWEEEYTWDEVKKTQTQYAEDIRKISSKGILAIHFINYYKMKHAYYQYFKPICKWLKKNQITLTEDNYFSFYYVYALFSSQDKKLLIQDRHILIITSLSEKKEEKIKTQIMSDGAKSVNFYTISKNKALLERIDIGKIKVRPDIILVAAGIGSSNILAQCEVFNTLCIDIGVIMERMIDEAYKKQRLFVL